MTIGTRLHTFLFGRHVGTDAFGNRYFEEKKTKKGQRSRRWVMYQGLPEPSKIPPLWNGWLHYTIDALPSSSEAPTYHWQKEHLPNLTGTAGAYLPPGHLRSGGERAPTTADYVPWTPSKTVR